MIVMSITELKRNVCAAIGRAEAGETIYISRRGKIVAEIVPKIHEPEEYEGRI